MNTIASSQPRGTDVSLPLPYQPRKLTRTELTHKDVYAFLSPRLNREVWVTGALTFAACLRFEFDPDTVSYCERPRKLEVADKVIEITYWTRRTDGTETLWLLVPASESEPAVYGTCRYRDERRAREAAERAQVHLSFLFESELIALGTSIGTWFQLLPFVQTGHVMENYAAIEPLVREHFRLIERATFVQMEAALGGFNSHDVRSVMCRAIHEGWLTIDPSKPIHIHTSVARGPQYDL